MSRLRYLVNHILASNDTRSSKWTVSIKILARLKSVKFKSNFSPRLRKTNKEGLDRNLFIKSYRN